MLNIETFSNQILLHYLFKSHQFKPVLDSHWECNEWMSYHLKWWYLNVIPSQMMVFSWEKDLWKCRIFRSKSIITDPSNYSLALAHWILDPCPSFSQIFIQWNSLVPGWSLSQPDLYSVELFGSWLVWLMFSFLTVWDFSSPLTWCFNLSFRSNIVKSQYSNIPPLKT